jgi:glycosyltransferase involved in cell wall biosynthesis
MYNGIDVRTIANTNPASLHEEYNQIEQEDSIVGIVANYNRKIKRLDIFIEASAEISKRREDVKFLIIGGGRKNEKELRELARIRGIADRLIFGGIKENPIPYVKSFDIGVLTSDSEGLSNTIMEYMAAGIPCVATDVGGNRELVEHGVSGILVPPGNPLVLAEAICSLLQDPERSRRMAMEAKRIVSEKYSWDVIIKKTEDYYLSLVKR